MLVEVMFTRFNQEHLNFNQLHLDDPANKQHDPYPHRHKDGHSQTMDPLEFLSSYKVKDRLK